MRRVDAYLAAVAGARADDPVLLWPELVDALRGWTTRHGNPYDAKNVRVLAKDRDLARTFLRAFESDGNLIPGLRERPPAAAPTFPSGDLLALAEHIYRQERGLSVPRLMQENTARGGSETREAALTLIMRAGWCVDGPGLTLLLPETDYYTGNLWSRYDRAVQHPDNMQAQEQARRLMATIRPALLHDLRRVLGPRGLGAALADRRLARRHHQRRLPGDRAHPRRRPRAGPRHRLQRPGRKPPSSRRSRSTSSAGSTTTR